MTNPETVSVLRAILDDVCKDVAPSETSARAYGASKLLESVAQARPSAEELKESGRHALRRAPTMWR
jgi:hypothetical protein